jgi:hypothetical protein
MARLTLLLHISAPSAGRWASIACCTRAAMCSFLSMQVCGARGSETDVVSSSPSQACVVLHDFADESRERGDKHLHLVADLRAQLIPRSPSVLLPIRSHSTFTHRAIRADSSSVRSPTHSLRRRSDSGCQVATSRMRPTRQPRLGQRRPSLGTDVRLARDLSRGRTRPGTCRRAVRRGRRRGRSGRRQRSRGARRVDQLARGAMPRDFRTGK